MKAGGQRPGEPAEGAAHAWPGLLRLMLARLVLLVGLMAVLSLLLPGDSFAFYAFMALAYVVSILYALWSKDRARVAQFVPLQFVVDLVLVTGVVYFTGGPRSDLSLLYPLIILSAGIVTGPGHAVAITLLSSVTYVTLIVLMKQGVLVPYGPAPVSESWPAVTRALGMRVLVFVCFGLASAYVSQRCQYTDRRLRRFRELAEIVFRNVRAGLMLLDHGGTILMVNERACALLGHEEEELLGRPVNALFAAGAVLLDREQETNAERPPCYFKRPDGSMFPVSLETAKLSLPAEAVPGLDRHGIMEGYLMVFSDISRILELQERIEKAERVKSTVRLAGEIAHEIRNPLAAISGAAQYLQQLERKAMMGDAQSIAQLPKERSRIFGIIVAESGRLDKTIERFVDYTEYSPEAISVRLASTVETHS